MKLSAAILKEAKCCKEKWDSETKDAPEQGSVDISTRASAATKDRFSIPDDIAHLMPPAAASPCPDYNQCAWSEACLTGKAAFIATHPTMKVKDNYWWYTVHSYVTVRENLFNILLLSHTWLGFSIRSINIVFCGLTVGTITIVATSWSHC